MKLILRRSILTLLIVGSTLAFAADSPADRDVEKAESAWAEALKTGDRAAIAAMLSDDLIYTHSTGIVENKAEYLDKLKTGSQKYTGVDYSQRKVRSWFGNTGLVNAVVRMTGATNNVPFDNTVFLLHVWVKQGNTWKLVTHQTTKKPS